LIDCVTLNETYCILICYAEIAATNRYKILYWYFDFFAFVSIHSTYAFACCVTGTGTIQEPTFSLLVNKYVPITLTFLLIHSRFGISGIYPRIYWYKTVFY